jgi:hypothetical protein
MARSNSEHPKLTRWQARDSNERLSLGRTRTAPLGSPSAGSESDDDSRVEMWYVALTLMHK